MIIMAFMFFWFRILECFFAHLPLTTFGFDCPGLISPPQGFSYARIESNISGRSEEVYKKIRIKLFYDPSIEDKPYKRLVQEAADFWSNALSVKPADGRIFMSRDCENKAIYKDLDGSGRKEKYCLGSCANVTQCIDIEVRNEHLDGCKSCDEEGQNCTKQEAESGTGVDNADVVFYVTANDCRSGSTVAYAGFCDIEPVLDRPVFALINICAKTAARHSDDKTAMLRTIKHEMMHALGFGRALFRLFRDKEGKPLWPRDEDGLPLTNDTGFSTQKVMKGIDREWHVRGDVIQRTLYFLVTPNVVREAQAHFGCSELEGAELEDIPKSGSELDHLEARVFFDDGMKPNMDSSKGLFSRLDFAVLDDSGWYQVNYSLAEEMDFGRHLGCDFCMKSCKFWIDKKRKEGKRVDPYCDCPKLEEKRGITCIGKEKRFSGCPLVKIPKEVLCTVHDPNSVLIHLDVPRQYQHFDQISGVDDNLVNQFGSFDGYADFCPVIEKHYDVTEIVGDDFDCENQTNPTRENSSWTPCDANPSQESNRSRKPLESIPPSDSNSTNKPLETNPTRESNPTKKPWKPKPVKEAKDEEDETDQSTHLGSSALLVFLFPLVVIMLCRALFKFSHELYL